MMQQTPRQKTKSALIKAAQRLFAEKGIGTVSVKEITLAAGARNPSAVHYHFGNLETLIKEVFTQRYNQIEQSRLARIAQLDVQAAAHPVVELLTAGLGPLFEACLEEDGRLYARFCVQLAADPRFEMQDLIEDLGMTSIPSLRTRIAAILTHLPDHVLQMRFRQALSISLMQSSQFAERVEAKTAEPVEQAIREAAVTLAGYLSAERV
ncbi:MAG: helix-turn-helix domain-containing protein [Pseudomonadota bacterium]